MLEKIPPDRLEALTNHPELATNVDVILMAKELFELKEKGVRLVERDGKLVRYRSV